MSTTHSRFALFRLAMSAEVILVVAKEMFGFKDLPLGGGHLAQIGLLFIAAFLALEIKDCFWILISENLNARRHPGNQEAG